MPNVKKRTGELQEFDRTKMEKSIHNAGASEELAKKVAERIRPDDGVDTAELRRRIAEELRKEDANLAEAYLSTVRLPAKAGPETAAGMARLPLKLPRVPHFPGAGRARVLHEGHATDLRIEPTLQVREIWMNRADLRNLGVADGARVAVRFPKPQAAPTGPEPPRSQVQNPAATMPAVTAQPQMPASRA